MTKNFYITTPIYYPSGKPHMGHAYSSIVADIFARFKRIEGYDVLFLTGTDEHGQKIQKEAEKMKKDPKVFCDEISQTFRSLTKILNLTNDDFIRTTETRHLNSVNEIWNRLIKSGDIYLDKYSGWYSVSDEAYYDKDEIEEKDGRKLSKASGSEVEWVEEESYFFKLSAFQKKLLDHYKKNDNFILPQSRKNEVISFVEKGLKDLSISRTSFSWGIPVPQNNKHVIYVWLDALTNYLSALNFPNTEDKKYKAFWPADVHIIGKDILRFHAIYWPAFLIAANLPLPKRVFGHGWILSDDKKMSKSLGNILDPIEVIKDYGIDQLRYYLIKEVSLGNDGSISMENLKNCINNDLANNYGNLCQRVFSFIKKNCNNKIPKASNFKEEDKRIKEVTKERNKTSKERKKKIAQDRKASEEFAEIQAMPNGKEKRIALDAFKKETIRLQNESDKEVVEEFKSKYEGRKVGGDASGMKLVGEDGPEIVEFKTAVNVVPAHRTQETLKTLGESGGTNIVTMDLPPIKAPTPEVNVASPPATETEEIPSVNPFNNYMVLTPEILRFN